MVPRPKHVPRPSPKAGLKGTRGGGVAKHGPAPKFYGSRQQGGSAQAVNRNVKVTIGNKLRWVLAAGRRLLLPRRAARSERLQARVAKTTASNNNCMAIWAAGMRLE